MRKSFTAFVFWTISIRISRLSTIRKTQSCFKRTLMSCKIFDFFWSLSSKKMYGFHALHDNVQIYVSLPSHKTYEFDLDDKSWLIPVDDPQTIEALAVVCDKNSAVWTSHLSPGHVQISLMIFYDRVGIDSFLSCRMLHERVLHLAFECSSIVVHFIIGFRIFHVGCSCIIILSITGLEERDQV